MVQMFYNNPESSVAINIDMVDDSEIHFKQNFEKDNNLSEQFQQITMKAYQRGEKKI